MGDVLAVGNADLGHGQGQGLGPVLEVADIGVVHHLEVAAGVHHRGGTDADALDGAAEVVQDDDVAHVILALQHDEQAGDHVLDEPLGRKADDQRDDAQAGEGGGGVETQDGQSPDDAQDHAQVGDDVADELVDRAGPGALAALVQDEAQDPADQIGEGQGADGGQNAGDDGLKAPRLPGEQTGKLLPQVFADRAEDAGISRDEDEDEKDQGYDKAHGSVASALFLVAHSVFSFRNKVKACVKVPSGSVWFEVHRAGDVVGGHDDGYACIRVGHAVDDHADEVIPGIRIRGDRDGLSHLGDILGEGGAAVAIVLRLHVDRVIARYPLEVLASVTVQWENW